MSSTTNARSRLDRVRSAQRGWPRRAPAAGSIRIGHGIAPFASCHGSRRSRRRLRRCGAASSAAASSGGPNGLGDVIVHPGRQACLAVPGHRVRRHRDDPERPVRPLRADPPGRAEPVELGHLDIHEDDVVVGRRSSARCAWSPSPTTSASYDSWPRRRRASFWFTRLSSARRIRSGWRSPSDSRHRPAPARGAGLATSFAVPEQHVGEGVVQGGWLDRLREPRRDAGPLPVAKRRSTRG